MSTITINGVKADSNTRIEYKPNPKRVGKKAWARYEEYETCETIGEYLELADPKYAKADLRYDLEHGHLTILEDDDA